MIERCVLSVMGPHAGEDEAAIFERKRRDIAVTGETLWLCQSPGARPNRVRPFFDGIDCQILFLAPAKPRGARPTTEAARMVERSFDGVLWSLISPKIGPVTGRAVKGAYAFVLTALFEHPSDAVDLSQYADEAGEPIRFRLGASTMLARSCVTTEPPKMRRVLAAGRLASPYAVWVR